MRFNTFCVHFIELVRELWNSTRGLMKEAGYKFCRRCNAECCMGISMALKERGKGGEGR